MTEMRAKRPKRPLVECPLPGSYGLLVIGRRGSRLCQNVML